MAHLRWFIRNVKNGVRVEAKVTLRCNHTLSEFATARTELGGKNVVSRLLSDKIADHKKTCKGT